jgi:hypothetical protein
MYIITDVADKKSIYLSQNQISLILYTDLIDEKNYLKIWDVLSYIHVLLINLPYMFN